MLGTIARERIFASCEGYVESADQGPNIWQFYGLDKSPFATTSQYAVYYPFPQWQQYLGQLNKFCDSPLPLMLVVGVVGSGKTMLIAQFLAQTDENLRTCRLKGQSSLTVPQLIQALSHAFNLPYDTLEHSSEQQLDAYLAILSHNRHRYLLLIDDAHQLPLDTLGAVTHLLVQQENTRLGLQLVLFGEPSLYSRLKTLMVKDCVRSKAEQLVLDPLTFKATKQYLKYRLNKVGITGALPLNRAMIRRIYELSDGVPGRINRVAEQALLDAIREKEIDMVQQAKRISWQSFIVTNRVKLISGTLLCLAVVSLWMAQRQLREQTLDNKPIGLSHVQEQSHTLVTGGTDTTPPEAGQQPFSAVGATTPQRNNPSVQTAVTTDTSSARDTMPAVQTGSTETSSAQLITPAQNAPVSNVDTTTTVQQTAKKAIQPMASQPDVSTMPPKPAAITIASPADRYTSMEKSLLAKEGYTLQLVAVGDERKAQHFLQTSLLKGGMDYFHTQRGGKSWYVIVYGHYKSPTEAVDAMRTLPPAVQNLHPWVRPFPSVHQAIQATS